MTNLRTPILVGVAQINQRIKDVTNAKEPVDLMIESVRLAAEDTEQSDVLKHVGSIRVSKGVWPYLDPGKFISEQLNLADVESGITVFGGNGVQTALNLSCLDIQEGLFDVVALTGAECGYTQANARRQGKQPQWRSIPGTPSWSIPYGIGARNELENARGVGSAAQVYAIFENALRFKNNESLAEHRARVSDLWSRFNNVAQSNPHAWIQDDVTAEEISTTHEGNRPIAFPYPKLMNANNNVDQGAALLLTSTEFATKLGIPKSKWVYPWAGTDAHDTRIVSHRADLTRAPGLRQAALRVMELADVTVSDIDHVDLYSCFPSAVQVAANEIGIDQNKNLTVTGGLTFGGGPLNNYVMHAIARMAEVLREKPNEIGLVTANGGYLTKHAHGIYSATPPSSPFQHEDVQSQVDTSGDRETDAEPKDAVVVEGYTVMYNREGAARGIAACLTRDGKRTWATTEDRELMHEMSSKEFCGQEVRLQTNGSIVAN